MTTERSAPPDHASRVSRSPSAPSYASLLGNLKRALGVIAAHPFLFLLLAALVALPSEGIQHLSTTFLLSQLSGWLPAHGVVLDPQKGGLVVLALADLAVLPWVCIVGAFVLPAALRIYTRHQAGEPVDFKDVLNFGLARWGRVIKPYTLITLIIAVGFVVLVPGILYTLYFAFVIAIVTLDDSVQKPLVRSRKLVRGRLGRIFRTYLLFIPWWGWYRTLGELAVGDLHPGLRALLSTVDVLVTFAMELCVLQLYFERMEQLQSALEARRNDPEPSAALSSNPS